MRRLGSQGYFGGSQAHEGVREDIFRVKDIFGAHEIILRAHTGILKFMDILGVHRDIFKVHVGIFGVQEDILRSHENTSGGSHRDS